MNDAIREWKDWATPQASDAKRGRPEERDRSSGDRHSTLANDVNAWRSLHGPSTEPGGSVGSPPVYLNPSFVEALMGFPIGWTVLERSETLVFLW